jgi:NADPH oxidase
MEEEDPHKKYLEIHVFMTGSIKNEVIKNVMLNDGDVRDPVTLLKSHTYYGRPNFHFIFQELKESHYNNAALLGKRV